MPLFTRITTDSKHCPYVLPFCETSLGPGPAIMNAASAKGNMQYNDPSLRNPNAALDKYDHRMAPEMIVGAIFVAILVSFAIGLWIALDKNLRARLRRWMTCGWRKEDNGTRSAENSLGVQSNMSRISTTSMEEDLESAMRMPLHRPHVSHMPSPLRQNTTETKSLSPLLAQIAPLPALSVS